MKLVPILVLNVWAITADILSPNINILDELQKIKTMEIKMKSMESEMAQLQTKNTGKILQTILFKDHTETQRFNIDSFFLEN